MSKTIIGIDLGTTNSEAAILREGRIHVFSGPEGKLLPSFIGLDQEGNLLVGEAARNQYAAFPERTIKSIKRLMGQDITLTLGEVSYTPQELSAVLLRTLAARAEKELGHPALRAVITVPAYFSDAQRQATREAGEIAGLEVVKIINEPTAASLVYGGGSCGDERLVMIYDLGGGTFDVSITRVQEGIIEVISSPMATIHPGGGDDFEPPWLVKRWILERSAGNGPWGLDGRRSESTVLWPGKRDILDPGAGPKRRGPKRPFLLPRARPPPWKRVPCEGKNLSWKKKRGAPPKKPFGARGEYFPRGTF